MLKLNPNPTFQLPVSIPVAGQAAPAKITLIAKYRTVASLKEFSETISKISTEQAIKETISGWDGVDTEFNDDSLARLLDNYPGAGLVIMKAYFDEAHKALRGN